MRFRLSVTFPEVSAGHACHEVVVEERHFRIAVNRGLMRILDNPHPQTPADPFRDDSLCQARHE